MSEENVEQMQSCWLPSGAAYTDIDHQKGRSLPLGLRILNKCCGVDFYRKNRKMLNSAVLFLIWSAYVTFHSTRKVYSIVKPELKGCDQIKTPDCNNTGFAPFNDVDSNDFFALLEAIYFSTYSISMIFFGHYGSRVSNKWTLTVGCFLCGFGMMLYSFMQFFQLHSVTYVHFVNIFNAVVQGFGLNACLAILERFFKGHTWRAMIFAVFNTSPYLGNVLGMNLATHFLKSNWAFSFIWPGVISFVMSVVTALFLMQEPETVGFTDYNKDKNDNVNDDEVVSLLTQEEKEKFNLAEEIDTKQEVNTSFFSRVRTSFPLLFQVVCYTIVTFFSKSLIYIFFNWLPIYLDSIKIANVIMTPEIRRNINTCVDVGNLAGSIVAGVLVYATSMPLIVIVLGQFLAGIMVILLEIYGSNSLGLIQTLFCLLGIFSNICPSLVGSYLAASLTSDHDKNALMNVGTLTSFINGFGSFGTAIGPLLFQKFTKHYGWNSGTKMMGLLVVVATLPLGVQFYYEIKNLITKHYGHTTSQQEKR